MPIFLANNAHTNEISGTRKFKLCIRNNCRADWAHCEMLSARFKITERLDQSDLVFDNFRYEAYRHLLDCLGRLLVAANLPATATDIPLSTEASGEADRQSKSQLIVCANPTPPVARRCLLSILQSIIKCDDTLAHFEVRIWLNAYLEDYFPYFNWLFSSCVWTSLMMVL